MLGPLVGPSKIALGGLKMMPNRGWRRGTFPDVTALVLSGLRRSPRFAWIPLRWIFSGLVCLWSLAGPRPLGLP
eukprot:4660117-Pyramimonas_sp.AAC.1